MFRAVDGGYYDNSGIVSALDVVNEWLRRRGRAATKIALVEIRASGRIDQGPLGLEARHACLYRQRANRDAVADAGHFSSWPATRSS